MSSDVNATVPRAVQVAAAWSWRVLAILLGLAAFVAVLAYSKVIWVPVLIALLLAVLLQPFVELLQRRAGFGRGLASAVAVVVLVLGLAGLLVLTGRAIARGVADLWLQAREGVRELIGFLADGPLGLDGDQLDALIDELSNQLGSNTGTLVSGALSVTVTIGHILAGTLLTLFCLLFFLKDGAQIWAWLVRLLPQAARMPVYEASRRGARTLTSFTRTQILVALIDAVGIGLGAFILGIPLAGPLAILVFVGSFIPFVGAVVTGAIAVLVAFVDQGLGTALLMLGVVLLVQQVESHVLQPMLLGHAVSLHPVAVLLSVTAGSLAAGIVGALFAVPVAATLNTVVLYLHGRDKFPELGRDPEGLDRWLRAFEAGVVPVAEVAGPAQDRTAPDRADP